MGNSGVDLNPHVDIERFRADLREGGVEEMLGILLDTFAQDCPGRLAALEQAVQDGNAKTIRKCAHAFKSGAGTVRATVFADGLRENEAAGQSGVSLSRCPIFSSKYASNTWQSSVSSTRGFTNDN